MSGEKLDPSGADQGWWVTFSASQQRALALMYSQGCAATGPGSPVEWRTFKALQKRGACEVECVGDRIVGVATPFGHKVYVWRNGAGAY